MEHKERTLSSFKINLLLFFLGAIGIGVSLGLATWLYWFLQGTGCGPKNNMDPMCFGPPDPESTWGIPLAVSFGVAGLVMTTLAIKGAYKKNLISKIILCIALTLISSGIVYYIQATSSHCSNCPLIEAKAY